MKGYLMLNDWSGKSRHEVEIVAETPKRYKIKLLARTPLAGRNRWGNEGDEVYVPKYAIKK